jgi:acyl-coenzyme A thioesterase 13
MATTPTPTANLPSTAEPTPPTNLPPSTTTALPPSDPATLAHITTLLTTRTLHSPIYNFLFPTLSITHASRGHIIARLPLTTAHVNSSGSIHGGVSATIVDWAGGMAIAAWDLRQKTGVSVDIHVTYLSGARIGDTLEIEGRAERVGGSVGFTSVGIWKVDGEGGRGGRRSDGGRYADLIEA